MNTLEKLELLKDTYSDAEEFDLIIGKLLDVALSRHRLMLEKYEQDLRVFEQRYQMTSESFYFQFEAGEVGDDVDFFEWSGLYELYQTILKKIRQLERAV